MNVTQKTIDALYATHLERIEADVVNELVQRLGLAPGEALERYYGSRLSRWVAEGRNGVQYLSPACLVDWLLEEKS